MMKQNSSIALEFYTKPSIISAIWKNRRNLGPYPQPHVFEFEPENGIIIYTLFIQFCTINPNFCIRSPFAAHANQIWVTPIFEYGSENGTIILYIFRITLYNKFQILYILLFCCTRESNLKN